MSEPMHPKKRLFIALFFVVVFIILIPVLVLYSTGYRLDKDFSLFPTGGIYVFYPESGAEILVEGEQSERTSLFERGIFIDNLDPKSYNIEVRKELYRPWKKTVDVAEKRVAEAYPFLIPEVISTSSIPRFVTVASGASVTNQLYTNVVKMFASSTPTTIPAKSVGTLEAKDLKATSSLIISTSTAITRRNIEVSLIGGEVVAYWKGFGDSVPFYFCDSLRVSCKDSLVVTKDVKKVEFFPGRNDVVLVLKKDGLYVTELDTRSPQNTFQLVPGNIDFREDGDRVFIKDKTNYYELLFTASTTLNSISI